MPCVNNQEIITFSIGQFGVQINQAFWEMLCSEHGITTYGQCDEHTDSDMMGQNFFYNTAKGQYVPRSIQVDMEASVIDEVRTGRYRNLNHPGDLINAIEDSSSNYGRAVIITNSLSNRIAERLRYQLEISDNFNGFLVYCSSGGGAGAGTTSVIYHQMQTMSPKKFKFNLILLSSNKFVNSAVDPYNTSFSLKNSIEFTDVCLQVDNFSCYRILENFLEIQTARYLQVNRLIAQVIGSITCSLRFHNQLYADFNQLQVNIIPYPRIHFPMPSYSPLYCGNLKQFVVNDVSNITLDAFDPSMRMSSAKYEDNDHFAVFLQYRGKVSPSKINNILDRIKRKNVLNFVDWCPTGFKIGICDVRQCASPGLGIVESPILSCALLANHRNCVTGIKRSHDDFNRLFQKRSFLHWFVSEGVEEGEFTDNIEEVRRIISDYEATSQRQILGEEPESNMPDFEETAYGYTEEDIYEKHKNSLEFTGSAERM